MSRLKAIAVHTLDPRGRLNRFGLLSVAFLLLGLEIAAAALIVGLDRPINGAEAIGLKVLFFWMATAAISKRLHDLDRSAWWLLKAAGAIIAFAVVVTLVLMATLGNASMRPGELGFLLGVASTTVPVFVMILWLHCAPGDAGPNRFGPPPQGLAFDGFAGDGPSLSAASGR